MIHLNADTTAAQLQSMVNSDAQNAAVLMDFFSDEDLRLFAKDVLTGAYRQRAIQFGGTAGYVNVEQLVQVLASSAIVRELLRRRETADLEAG